MAQQAPAPAVPLPHPWQAVPDPATGLVYYWNTETNETKWTWPATAANPSTAAVAQAQASSAWHQAHPPATHAPASQSSSGTTSSNSGSGGGGGAGHQPPKAEPAQFQASRVNNVQQAGQQLLLPVEEPTALVYTSCWKCGSKRPLPQEGICVPCKTGAGEPLPPYQGHHQRPMPAAASPSTAAHGNAGRPEIGPVMPGKAPAPASLSVSKEQRRHDSAPYQSHGARGRGGGPGGYRGASRGGPPRGRGGRGGRGGYGGRGGHHRSGGDSEDGLDPMDPSSYSDAPVGSWGRGMNADVPLS
ncbi:hypothetical protein CAOG_03101 [Capsaspora owczarzaki ATCC 30864]|uniref:WW domain-containing protein n=1 Tax=Capsaspora owczarzaki (strain ATCC 30864) TaxID=595528 RepID=A0A0D2X276_CAPO3|nr:hypothetical protein CAOG_03101 [Capsaspora owczarzaki ATCC 30864]KJE92074.1 hypothetical protein CAOG_003101 [Capsaspora owczarzaki ATCC 30864]|eukprot:XP_004363940.1 hypothetical protein CAOG_03101 [Capsaspora owczarzaki ATCC 30864]